jgi:predicted nucleotidyltransferase
VVVAYIHGSWARGEPVARDLDVALVVDGDACARAWDVAERVHLRLQATLEAGHPPLDVRPMPLDELVFAARVLRDGIPAFERTHRERIAIETRVLSRWIDFRPSWLALPLLKAYTDQATKTASRLERFFCSPPPSR